MQITSAGKFVERCLDVARQLHQKCLGGGLAGWQPHLSTSALTSLWCFSTVLNPRRCVDDYDLVKQLYRGKASLLYRATCRHSNQPVALKLYRKHKLSTLNWYQVRMSPIIRS